MNKPDTEQNNLSIALLSLKLIMVIILVFSCANHRRERERERDREKEQVVESDAECAKSGRVLWERNNRWNPLCPGFQIAKQSVPSRLLIE